MQAVKMSPISHKEYLHGEQQSDVRHEYFDGYVYAMAGAGKKHNIISGNMYSALRQKARGTTCTPFVADMKVYIPTINRFYYPDVLLACDPNDNHEYYIEHPCFIIEVLSPSTENTDRREKLHAYQSIESLKEYLLVSQETMQIELYRRDKEHWQYYLLNNEHDVLQINCLDLELSMNDIYEGTFEQG